MSKLWPITEESTIRFSCFYPYKDNDKFHFACSTLEGLQSLVERFTEHKLEVVEEKEKKFFKKVR